MKQRYPSLLTLWTPRNAARIAILGAPTPGIPLFTVTGILNVVGGNTIIVLVGSYVLRRVRCPYGFFASWAWMYFHWVIQSGFGFWYVLLGSEVWSTALPLMLLMVLVYMTIAIAVGQLSAIAYLKVRKRSICPWTEVPPEPPLWSKRRLILFLALFIITALVYAWLALSPYCTGPPYAPPRIWINSLNFIANIFFGLMVWELYLRHSEWLKLEM